jgi:uncharacterized cysteine cluster protein YcgN (CxxCxxCC family)
MPRVERNTPVEEEDALCERCGRCCQEKLMVRGKIYLLPACCKYLDPDTRLCTIYERRAELNPECLDVATGLRLGVFPADCPYVRDIEGYSPPIEGVVDREMFEAIERGEITDDEVFEGLVKEKLRKARGDHGAG